MRDWNLARVVWVADRGFASAENRRYLQPRRRALHHRREAPLRLRRGRPPRCPGRAATPRRRQPAGQRGPHRRRRPVRDLLQPRAGRTRRRASASGWSPSSTEMIAGSDTADRHQTRRAARADLHQARPEPVPARHPRRAAARRRRPRSRPRQPGRQVPAALLRPETVRRGHRPGLQAAAGSRTRLARHEDHPGPAAGLPPPRRPHPRPRPAVLARAAADPRRRDHHRPHLDQDPRRARHDCTSASSPAPPARFRQRTELTKPNATSSPSSASTHPRRSSNSGRHRQRPDQHQHHRLDTRLPGRLPAFPQVKPQIPCPASTSTAEPGVWGFQNVAHARDQR